MALFGRMQDSGATGRQGAYERFWGRLVDLVAHGSDVAAPHIDVFRFPPGKRGCPMRDDYVYISGGMSEMEMPNSLELPAQCRRSEITTYSQQPGQAGPHGDDFIAAVCHHVASYPFIEGTFLAPGDTFDWGGPLLPGSQMEGFYLAGTPFIDRAALSKASLTATFFLHLVPIARSEMEYKLEHGVDALLDLFIEHNVEQWFALDRAPVV